MFGLQSERSGASDNANRDRRHSAAETPLAVRFTAIASKLFNLFFYKAFPHLIYSLFRVDKMFGLQSERNGVSENANRNRQLAGGDTPLMVRFTAITSKFTSYFFYKAFPHLI